MLGLVFPDAYDGLTLTDDKINIADDKLKAMEEKDASSEDEKPQVVEEADA